jgi:hypothetical protein
MKRIRVNIPGSITSRNFMSLNTTASIVSVALPSLSANGEAWSAQGAVHQLSAWNRTPQS